ncbi:MAG: peptidylprolyl isomerase [Betaproteobacteria bacterium]|jgi:peptidyl-prolyl cis-trans isomerase B (cyclophilin B)|nr:peptidyl-prolyl cis-trans isomerase [Betaproteobacteria bacterium]
MTNPKVELHIADYGVITLELDAEKAPKSVDNFIKYVEHGHYDNTIFHRVIPGFMIQGGGMEPGMKQRKTAKSVDNEANNGLKNENYTVAMARTSQPHSATAQFFINVADNGFLNHKDESPQGWGYAVFGKVVGGIDVVDKIKDVDTGRRGMHDDVPVDDVLITKAVIL